MRISLICVALFLALSLAAPTAAAGESSFLDELDAILSPPNLPPPPAPAPVRVAPAVVPPRQTSDLGASGPAGAVGLNAASAARAGDNEGWSGEREKSTSAPASSRLGKGNLYPEVRVRVTAHRHAVLSSNCAGRIDELNVEDGDRFTAGQVLARIDGSLYRMQIARAQAALQRQEVLYRLARELYELQSKGEAEVEVARMEMEVARADLQAVEVLLERTAVEAPFSGRVAEVLAKEKQYVAEGTPLLEILDDSTLELEFIIPSQWIRWFKPGYRFMVTIEETGTKHEAVLERLGGKVDPLSQSLKAYASLLDLSPDLMEGMSGEAEITPPEE